MHPVFSIAASLSMTIALAACGSPGAAAPAAAPQPPAVSAPFQEEGTAPAASASSASPAGSSEQPESINITLTVGRETFRAVLESNEAARALAAQLPLTLDMSELNGNEKYFYLDESLPTEAQSPGQIQAGDLMLYGDNCLVVFYQSFSSGFRYTRLGAVDNPESLAEALGSAGVTVSFALS